MSLSPIQAETATAYEFHEGELPVACALNTGRKLRPASETVTITDAPGWDGKERKVLSSTAEGKHGGMVTFQPLGEDELLGKVEAMTIAMRVSPTQMKPTLTFLWRIYMSTKNPGFISFNLQTNEGDESIRKGTFRWTVQGADANETVASTQAIEFHSNHWRHVAVTFKAGEVCFYLDGERVGDPVTMKTTSIPAVDPRAYLSVGMLEGMLDEPVIVVGKALNEEEIRILAVKPPSSNEAQAFLKQ